jgi:hypothetical protein
VVQHGSSAPFGEAHDAWTHVPVGRETTMKPVFLSFGLLALALSACATDRMSDNEKLALYRAHALPSVQSFRYLNRIDGWTPLGDAALAIWTRPNEAYLLEVDKPCPDLDFAMAISLTSQFGIVYSRFDKVIPRTGVGGPQPMPCHIRQIRPLDVKAIRSAEKDIRRQGEQASG